MFLSFSIRSPAQMWGPEISYGQQCRQNNHPVSRGQSAHKFESPSCFVLRLSWKVCGDILHAVSNSLVIVVWDLRAD